MNERTKTVVVGALLVLLFVLMVVGANMPDFASASIVGATMLIVIKIMSDIAKTMKFNEEDF